MGFRQKKPRNKIAEHGRGEAHGFCAVTIVGSIVKDWEVNV